MGRRGWEGEVGSGHGASDKDAEGTQVVISPSKRASGPGLHFPPVCCRHDNSRDFTGSSRWLTSLENPGELTGHRPGHELSWGHLGCRWPQPPPP